MKAEIKGNASGPIPQLRETWPLYLTSPDRQDDLALILKEGNVEVPGLLHVYDAKGLDAGGPTAQLVHSS
jgi:hypothetical protein